MDTPVPTYHVRGFFVSDRSHQGPRRKRPRVAVTYGDPGSQFSEGLWSVNVQRVGVWALGYLQHRFRWSSVRVFVEPWDVWGSLDPSVRRSLLMSFLRKQAVELSGSNGASSVDADFLKSYPALGEYMMSQAYPDGTPRLLSTLTLFREDGFWKACLNEKDQGLVLFVAEPQFLVVFEALELLLQEDRPPWRKSTSKGRPGARKGGAGG